MSTPWMQLKIAFSFEGPEDKLWSTFYPKPKRGFKLPKGWTLSETSSLPAFAVVAIFDVEGFPSESDGERVAALLKKLE